MVAKRVKKISRKKSVKRQTKSSSKHSRIAPTPMRHSRHAEEQGMKTFLVAALSIVLIVVLALFLFYQDSAVAGQAVAISSSSTSSCGAEGDLCLMLGGSVFNYAEGDVGDEFTVTVVGYTASDVYSTNLQIKFPENLELDESSGIVASQIWEGELSGTAAGSMDDGSAATLLDYSAYIITDLSSGSGSVEEIELLELTFTIGAGASSGDILAIEIGATTTDSDDVGFFQLDETNNLVFSEGADVEVNANTVPTIDSLTDSDLDGDGDIGSITIEEGDSDPLTLSISASDAETADGDLELVLTIHEELISEPAVLTLAEGESDSTGVTTEVTLSNNDGSGNWELEINSLEDISEATVILAFTVSDGTDTAVSYYVIEIGPVTENSDPEIGLFDSTLSTTYTSDSLDSSVGDTTIVYVGGGDVDADTPTISIDISDAADSYTESFDEGSSSTDAAFSLSSGVTDGEIWSWEFNIDSTSLANELYTITFTTSDGEGGEDVDHFDLTVTDGTVAIGPYFDPSVDGVELIFIDGVNFTSDSTIVDHYLSHSFYGYADSGISTSLSFDTHVAVGDDAGSLFNPTAYVSSTDAADGDESVLTISWPVTSYDSFDRSDYGEYGFSVSVSDGVDTTTEPLTLIVGDADYGVPTFVTAIDDQEIDEGDVMELTFSVTALEYETLEFDLNIDSSDIDASIYSVVITGDEGEYTLSWDSTGYAVSETPYTLQLSFSDVYGRFVSDAEGYGDFTVTITDVGSSEETCSVDTDCTPYTCGSDLTCETSCSTDSDCDIGYSCSTDFECVEDSSTDVDGDGIITSSDCDDTDAAVGIESYYYDGDGDGYGDTELGLHCEYTITGDGVTAVSVGGDCDDTDATLTTDCTISGTGDSGAGDSGEIAVSITDSAGSESQSLSYTASSTEAHTVSVFVWAGWADDGSSTPLISSVVVSE